MREYNMTPCVREHEPRLFTRLCRNHFAEGPQKPLCSPQSHSIGTRGVHITAAIKAAQRSTAYRFGIINCVFNPRKVLLGDDEGCLKDDGRTRDWLDV